MMLIVVVHINLHDGDLRYEMEMEVCQMAVRVGGMSFGGDR